MPEPLWDDICCKAGEMDVCKSISVLVYKAHSFVHKLLIRDVFSVVHLLKKTWKNIFSPEITKR